MILTCKPRLSLTLEVVGVYKTKTQKRNALKAIQAKAMKLFASGAISMKDADNISKIVNLRIKQL